MKLRKIKKFWKLIWANRFDMLLELKNINASFGHLPVLHDVSLGIDPGEIVVLIGPNGAGKTTVLKSIFHLVNVTKGRVEYEGENITKLPTHALLEMGIAFVPQGRLVFSHLTVEENLRMGGYIYDNKETVKEALQKMFRQFPVLHEKRGELAGNLSGGQQQLLALGRALMVEPKVLLLDEPSLGLAPVIVQEIFSELKKIQARGIAVLLVEQNVRMALTVASRGYLLAQGQVRFAGTAKELGNPKVLQEAYLGK